VAVTIRPSAAVGGRRAILEDSEYSVIKEGALQTPWNLQLFPGLYTVRVPDIGRDHSFKVSGLKGVDVEV
jgi:hypothetical protein